MFCGCDVSIVGYMLCGGGRFHLILRCVGKGLILPPLLEFK